MSWLSKQGRAAAESYDRDEALAGSHPTGILLAAGALGIVLLVLGYVPFFAERVQISRPWIPLVLTVTAGLTTYVAWRHQCRGVVGTTATLFDNALYSAALTYAATNAAHGQWATGLAVTHGLMVLAFASQAYALTLAFAVVMALPLVATLPTSSPDPTVVLILCCTYVLVLALSLMTRQRLSLLKERKRLKEAVQATRQVADESVQLALTTTLLGLGHFLHELRNTQAVMQANLDYIRISTDLRDDASEALADAIATQREQHELVVDTIEGLKDRSKSTNTVFLLGDLLKAVATDQRGVDVAIEGSARRFVVTGTPDHLRIVLANLVRNAEQAGATEVRVTVRLEPSGRAVRIVVADNGPGLPSGGGLFLPFTETEKVAGSGLGLYLCRRYIELFGGTIEVDDGPLDGAAFRITIPGRVLAGEAPGPQPASKAPDSVASL